MQTLPLLLRTGPWYLRSHLLHRIATLTLITFAPIVSIHAETKALGADSSSVPNIVLIVADDMGWSDIGYHNDEVLTPNLDRLAAGGVRLERHYVSPTCSPTRVALVSGRNPSRYGILGPISGKSSQHLPLGTVTLPQLLAEKGYETHIAGKWHLGLQTQYGPTKYGFTTSYGYLHGQIDPYTHLYKYGDRTWHRNDELLDESGTHATDLLTADAVRFIKARRKGPFYLSVTYSVPHYPLNEPKEWTSKYDGKVADPWRKQNNASNTHMDDGIGQIVKALEDAGVRENTLLVFTSDNGGQKNWGHAKNQYEGRYPTHTRLGDNRPLRGWKGGLYEGGVRVPALANWPGKLTAGKSVESSNQSADWMPTFLGLAGVEVDPAWKLDGQDIWPSLVGKAKPSPRSFYWKTPGQSAVRQGDWKLIVSRKGKQVELFDVQNDPYEKQEVSHQYPKRVKELLAQLEREQQRDSEGLK